MSGWTPSLSSVTNWQSSIEELDGSRVLKLLKPQGVTGKNLTLSRAVENRGGGIYEISYRFRTPFDSQYPQSLFTVYGNQSENGVTTEKTAIPVLVYSHSYIIQYGVSSQVTIIPDVNATTGWIDCKFTVNTKNGAYSFACVYNNSDGTPVTVEKKDLVLRNGIDNITKLGLEIRNGAAVVDEGIYYFDDIKVKKITEPAVLSAVPENNAVNTALRPVIDIAFNMPMSQTTLNKNNIIIFRGNTPVSANSYTVSPSERGVRVTFNSDLDYKTAYTVKLTADIKSESGLFLESEYNTVFMTKAKSVDIESLIITNSDDTVISSLDAEAGKPVNVKMRIKNNEITEGREYRAFITLNAGNRETYAVITRNGSLPLGGAEDITASFTVPQGVSGCFVEGLLWDSYENMEPLFPKVTKP
jgi:hypothetical protein